MSLTLTSIHIYPVKGLKGISLESARCTDCGLEHDRRWMVVDRDGKFISQRSHPKMATIWTDVDGGSLVLSAPDVDSVELPVAIEQPGSIQATVWNSTVPATPGPREADRWISDYLGEDLRFVHMPQSTTRLSNPVYAGPDKRVGFADGYAYLVIGEASLADLNAKLLAKAHAALPMNRFRPNLVVAGARPYEEDTWKRVRIGDAVIEGAKPCGRCQVTTTDQGTGELRGPEPLATLSSYRESKEFGVMFGMNFVSVQEGRVSVGTALLPE